MSEDRSPAALRAALAIAVGLVLADSSLVVLALPEIYRDFDVSVNAVIWVLVAFNLALAAAAVPAALVARRLGPARVTSAGLAVFALGGLLCGLSTSLAPLIAARCLQAIGGAAAVTGALELLPFAVGSERRAAAVWATAGAIGAALGPAAGGLLTELVSWQSIFLVQVPLPIAVAIPVLAVARLEATDAARRGELRETGPAASGREPRAGPGLRGPRGGALFDRLVVDRRLAPLADRRRPGGVRDAACRTRRPPPSPDRHRRPPRAPPPGRSWWPAGLPAWACFLGR